MSRPSSVARRPPPGSSPAGPAKAARLVTLDGWAGAVWSLHGEVEVEVAFAFVVEDGLIREAQLLAERATIGALRVGRA